jgi:hypothetical protein
VPKFSASAAFKAAVKKKEVIWLAQLCCPSGPFLLVHLLGA